MMVLEFVSQAFSQSFTHMYDLPQVYFLSLHFICSVIQSKDKFAIRYLNMVQDMMEGLMVTEDKGYREKIMISLLFIEKLG